MKGSPRDVVWVDLGGTVMHAFEPNDGSRSVCGNMGRSTADPPRRIEGHRRPCTRLCGSCRNRIKADGHRVLNKEAE